MAIKFTFDPNQQHQIRAIESAVNLFRGHPLVETGEATALHSLDAVPNLPESRVWLDEEQVLTNLNQVQMSNNREDLASADGNHAQLGQLEMSEKLVFDEGFTLDPRISGTWRYPSFVVEMETGTGKTYVYLRTIYELRRQYNFRKFIITVPSIAIYEGVKKSFDLLKSHFEALYSGEVAILKPYDGQQLSSSIREFANSNGVEILLMTIDSFNKATNIIYKPSEKLPGEKWPYQYLQETRPILILDESQNYKSAKSKQALRTLHPLLALEYTATPREKTNMIYRLTPYEASRQGLVKRIEVAGITEATTDATGAKLEVMTIEYSGGRLSARLKVLKMVAGVSRWTEERLFHGNDLENKTHNPIYGGYRVEEISLADRKIKFENGLEFSPARHEENRNREEVFRNQIRYTIKKHFEKQRALSDGAVRAKVLTLFFIDKVDNYRGANPMIKRIFEEEFERLKVKDEFFMEMTAQQVQKAYFAKRKAANGVEEEVDTAIEDVDKQRADREAEKEAYKLIMQNKEQLLSFEESACFIFAHSALKEGWDNPNVFQICTLNQIYSEVRKRQEIGRGLRLFVDSRGNRIADTTHNVLTVVANESYESFVENLQRQYRDDGETEIPKPQNAFHNEAKRSEKVFTSKEFRRFIDHLWLNTNYEIKVNQKDLVNRCVELLNNASFTDRQIRLQTGKVMFSRMEMKLVKMAAGRATINIIITQPETAVGQLPGMGLDTFNVTKTVAVGTNLGSEFRNEYLNLFRIQRMVDDAFDRYLVFSNGERLYASRPLVKELPHGQNAEETAEIETGIVPIVPVFLKRTAETTNLTQKTVMEIFTKMNPNKRKRILVNPEVFINTFIETIKETLAEHVADRIEYKQIKFKFVTEPDEIFPEVAHYPQGEIVEGKKDVSLYELVQIDSGVEREFTLTKLNQDERVILYFKFPPKYKIGMPKMIGNYNPDWGVVYQEDGKQILELVRETKGGRVGEELQFTNELRKIHCAQKHFEVLGINYREIRPEQFIDWWKKFEE